MRAPLYRMTPLPLVLVTGLVACTRPPTFSPAQQLSIYEAVLAANAPGVFSGAAPNNFLIDSTLITPIAKRTGHPPWIANKPMSAVLLHALLARGFARGVCQPVDSLVKGTCAGQVSGGVVALSAPYRGKGDTLLVSVLFYTGRSASDTTRDLFRFGAEEEYRLLPRAGDFVVVGHIRTMIT